MNSDGARLLAQRAPTEALAQLFGSAPSGTLQLPDQAEGRAGGMVILRMLLDALTSVRAGSATWVMSMQGVPQEVVDFLKETLGEGEVTIAVKGTYPLRIQETALVGVWFVLDASGTLQFIEVADVPAVVRGANTGGTRPVLEVPEAIPLDTMNVRAVLAEVAHHAQSTAPGMRNHVISFSLLPMNDVDMTFLKTTLGTGPLQAESRGYGFCVVQLTGQRHVWSVQYFNAGGAIILDTLEIGDVPQALCAAAQDLEDSAGRLRELLEEV